ncbi:hypothetical protein GGX14DRAFT_384123 [Mycena pura]|uniref:Uncharacterized protein n=1 Tax=Mycena pura TaxID=153505 RepID=A0AAD6YV22_9AGAR|nr:hypothetical protein GGX14DRAFT_384123 [Mycena pura]
MVILLLEIRSSTPMRRTSASRGLECVLQGAAASAVFLQIEAAVPDKYIFYHRSLQYLSSLPRLLDAAYVPTSQDAASIFVFGSLTVYVLVSDDIVNSQGRPALMSEPKARRKFYCFSHIDLTG